MFAGFGGDFAAAFCPAEKADLQKIRLDNVFEGVPLFAECGGECVDAGRAAIVGYGQRTHKRSIQFIQTERVDLLHFEGAFDDFGGSAPCPFTCA